MALCEREGRDLFKPTARCAWPGLMTRSNSLPRAAEGLMSVDNETQDSQAILEAFRAEIGNGLTYDDHPTENPGRDTARLDQDADTDNAPSHSGNPVGAVSQDSQSSVIEQLLPAQTSYSDKICSTDPTQPLDGTTTQDSGLSEPIQLVDTQRMSQGASDDIPNTLEVPVPESVPSGTTRPSPTMDQSQQTPTQVNVGRDYADFCNTLASSPGGTKDTQDENHSLQPDDSGAVNFGNLTDTLARPSSQVSEDAGFDTTKGDWRITDQTPQQRSSIGHTPRGPNVHEQPPETPALPRNPFASKPSISAPLAGSQLFGQTQLSSAVKRVSPTSSRPSPHMFLNSISSNVMDTSPLKNRTTVSSPTDIRTSSPQRLHELPSTVLREPPKEVDELETPLNSRSTGAMLIPESPTLQPKSSSIFQPMAHYEPMHKSQERKMIVEVATQNLSSGSDSDDPIKKMERRKRVQKKRSLASVEMEKVSFTRTTRRLSDEGAPGSKRRRTLSDVSELEDTRPSARQPPGEKKDEPVLEASPKVLPPSGDIAQDKLPGLKTRNSDLGRRRTKRSSRRRDAENGVGDDEIIPATSPVQSSLADHEKTTEPLSEPELPELIPEEAEPEEGVTRDNLESSSLPPLRRRGLRTYGGGVRRPRRNPFLSSSTSEVVSIDNPVDGNEPSPAPARLTRSAVISRVPDELRSSATEVPQKGKGAVSSSREESDPSTPLQATVPRAVVGSSDLTLLSTTPAASSNTTPGTQDSITSERTESAALPSPAVRTSLRKRVLRQAPRSESPQPAKRTVRAPRRSMRLGSESTDELQCSPAAAAAALETSLVQPQAGRSFRQSTNAPHTGSRLFEGMVFAVSFQSSQKQQERARLEASITQAGGQVLQDGFHELFEPCRLLKSASPVFDSDDLLKLTGSGVDSGFTALIADGHSRKPKYMQALALGLPCLAQQWVTACLQKGAVVDWQPYLLCAGASSVLGNAVRSRSLAAYPALSTGLTEMLEARPRHLDGQRVLIVVDSRKSRSEAKEPYIFLAQALGPTMSRVFTVQQAQEALREHQRKGKPFDWLYIDKGTGSAEAVLAAVAPGGGGATAGGGRKRRRSAPKSVVSNIRVLDDELVIQSLILGRILEEGEGPF